MNILLVTHSFAPMNKVSSLRLVHWVKYWIRSGHSVTVLTTKKYNFDGDLSLSIDFPSDSFKILEVPYLSRGDKLAAVDSKTENLRVSSSLKYFQSLNRFVRSYIGSLFDIHDLWVTPALKEARYLVAENNYDCIISSYAPPCAHVVASKIAKEFNIKWLADFRDLWADNHIGAAKFPFNIFERRKEKKYIQNADVLTTVSEPLAEKLKYKYCKPVEVVENGFDPDEYENLDLKKKAYFDNEILNIVYAGNIYPGRRDPLPLIKVIKKNNLNCQLHFYGPSNIALNTYSKNYPDIVKLHGNYPREEILSILSAADILLMLESGSKDADGVLTGKLFEYFALKKPILGIGFDQEVLLGKVIKQSGCGESFRGLDNEEEIVKFILSARDLDNFRDEAFISQFTRKSQAERILSYIK